MSILYFQALYLVIRYTTAKKCYLRVAPILKTEIVIQRIMIIHNIQGTLCICYEICIMLSQQSATT